MVFNINIIKRRAVFAGFFAFVLMLFVSLAGFNAAANSFFQADISNITNSMYQGDDEGMSRSVEITDEKECCTGEQEPCIDNDCDFVCMSSATNSHAVLEIKNKLAYFQPTLKRNCNNIIKDGISDQIHAPPPKG